MKLIEHECVVTDMNFTCDSTTCFGCNTKNPNKFIRIHSTIGGSEYLCMGCYSKNQTHSLNQCYFCVKTLKIDFSRLKIGDIICGGIDAFQMCYNCLCTNDYVGGDDNPCGILFGVMDRIPDDCGIEHYSFCDDLENKFANVKNINNP